MSARLLLCKRVFLASAPRTLRPVHASPFNSRSFSVSQPAHDITSAAATTFPPLQIGDLAAMGVASNSPIGLMQQFIELMHVSTGLPLWATIPASLFALKALTLPLALPLLRNQSRMESVTFEMHAAQTRLDKAKKIKHYGDINAATRDLQKIIVNNKINVFTLPFGIVLEGFFPILNIWAVRKLMMYQVPQFTEQNFGWITDLTVADPYHVLPITLGVSMFITNQLVKSTNARPRPKTTYQKVAYYGPDIFPFMIAAASWNWTVGVHLATASSVALMAIQNVLLRNATIRQKLRMAPRSQMPVHLLPKEKRTPLQSVQTYFDHLREDLFTLEQQKKAHSSVVEMMPARESKQRW